MTRTHRLLLGWTLLSFGLTLPATAGEHRIGAGLHYWQSIDQISDDFPDVGIADDGLSQVVSYQYLAGFIRFEAAAEYFSDGFQGSTDWAVAPQVYILAGRGIYGGVGVGATYSDAGFNGWSEPFFIGRAGFDFLILPKLHLDIHADYRFVDWEELENYDSDTITLGATLRVGF